MYDVNTLVTLVEALILWDVTINGKFYYLFLLLYFIVNSFWEKILV